MRRSTFPLTFFPLLMCALAGSAHSATVTTQLDGKNCRLVWQGDECIEVAFSAVRGLLKSPVNVRVDDRLFSFDGFYVAFNGQRDGYVIKSVSAESEKDSVRVTHLLESREAGRLPSPIRVVVRLAMSEQDKTVRFEINTDNGPSLHLDRLGVGNHSGAG